MFYVASGAIAADHQELAESIWRLTTTCTRTKGIRSGLDSPQTSCTSSGTPSAGC